MLKELALLCTSKRRFLSYKILSLLAMSSCDSDIMGEIVVQ